jgi:hypothetical protein
MNALLERPEGQPLEDVLKEHDMVTNGSFTIQVTGDEQAPYKVYQGSTFLFYSSPVMIYADLRGWGVSTIDGWRVA